MNTHHDDEPFFITDEIEAEMKAAGYTFVPPAHVSTLSLPQVVAALSDSELATWPSWLTEQEVRRRQSEPSAGLC